MTDVDVDRDASSLLANQRNDRELIKEKKKNIYIYILLLLFFLNKEMADNAPCVPSYRLEVRGLIAVYMMKVKHCQVVVK